MKSLGQSTSIRISAETRERLQRLRMRLMERGENAVPEAIRGALFGVRQLSMAGVVDAAALALERELDKPSQSADGKKKESSK